MSEKEQVSPPAGESSAADAQRGTKAGAAEHFSSAMRAAAPVVKRNAARFGDWLARIGWGKFFLLSLLLFAFGGITSSLIFERSPAIVVDKTDPGDRVNVVVSVSPEGIRIAPPKAPVASGPPGAERQAAPADREAVGEADGKDAKTASGTPTLRLDEKGLRILADKDGKRVAVTIDDKGIRVEDSAGATAESGAPRDGSVVLQPDVLSDPEKVNAAVDAARERIEKIVNDQVHRQVARRTRVYREQTSDWFVSFIALLVVTLIIVKVVLGSKRNAETRAQVASATAAEEGLKRQLAEAQLKMMQAQVEPHFLFNTLASVDYLIETDPSRASTMQKNLIQYLRAALPQMREGSTTLGKEISLCRSYLEILKVRMEDRLQFAITVPQGLASAQFPPMMLQSLVENSIKHGLEPKPEGGTMTITADVASGNLRVTVADSGLGFAAGTKPGAGVGLSNVRERLAALYGSRARLLVDANTPSGTIATIEVPYTFEAEGESPAAFPSAQPA